MSKKDERQPTAFEYLFANMGEHDVVTLRKAPLIRCLQIEIERSGKSKLFRFARAIPVEQINLSISADPLFIDQIDRILKDLDKIQKYHDSEN